MPRCRRRRWRRAAARRGARRAGSGEGAGCTAHSGGDEASRGWECSVPRRCSRRLSTEELPAARVSGASIFVHGATATSAPRGCAHARRNDARASGGSWWGESSPVARQRHAGGARVGAPRVCSQRGASREPPLTLRYTVLPAYAAPRSERYRGTDARCRYQSRSGSGQVGFVLSYVETRDSRVNCEILYIYHVSKKNRAS